MVQFVDEKTAWRTAGAPRRVIPDELQEWMDQTYAKNTVCEIPKPATDADTHDLLGLLKLYAKRLDLAMRYQYFDRDGAEYIRFKMRDKRPYHKADHLPRERR